MSKRKKRLLSKPIETFFGKEAKTINAQLVDAKYPNKITLETVRSWDGTPPDELVSIIGEENAHNLAKAFHLQEETIQLSDEEAFAMIYALESGHTELANEILEDVLFFNAPSIWQEEYSSAKLMMQSVDKDATEAKITMAVSEGNRANKVITVFISLDEDGYVNYSTREGMYLLEMCEDIVSMSAIVRVPDNSKGTIETQCECCGNKNEKPHFKIGSFIYANDDYLGVSAGDTMDACVTDFETGDLLELEHGVEYVNTPKIVRKLEKDENIDEYMFKPRISLW